MNSHKSKKHGIPANKKGRPRKYIPYIFQDIDIKKFDELFFDNHLRRPIEEEIIDVHNIVYQVFYFIYNGKYADIFYSHPNGLEEISILKKLYDDELISNEEKSKKNCDDIFYEYLKECKNKTNKKYFSFLLKFIIILKECYYSNQTILLNEEEKRNIIENLSLVELPNFCNDFYTEFLSKNNYFDLFENEKENIDEIVKVIQHFCYWLFKNKYTPYILRITH